MGLDGIGSTISRAKEAKEAKDSTSFKVSSRARLFKSRLNPNPGQIALMGGLILIPGLFRCSNIR